MNTNSQNRQSRTYHLDSIGNAAVLVAAVLITASAAFNSFTDSTVAPTQVARHEPAGNHPEVTASMPVQAPIVLAKR